MQLRNPFVLRTAVPPLDAVVGKTVRDVSRMGKRIVVAFDGEFFLVLHLMIAGRLQWLTEGRKPPGTITLALFEFPTGTLVLTEAGTKRRASLDLVHGEAALAAFDAGGLDVLSASEDDFRERLLRENHTVKRALTDPRLFSGIGNAYSDEILLRARLSPFALAQKLDDEEVARLFNAGREVLAEWTARLRGEAAGEFPQRVTAFRPKWPCMGVSANHARCAARRCSGSFTRRTKATTARGARRAV